MTTVRFLNGRNEELVGTLRFVPEADVGVIYLHGFARNHKERKFVALSTALENKRVMSLGFDFAGWGASGGERYASTVRRMAEDVVSAAIFLTQHKKIQRLHLCAHSLGACVAAQCLAERKMAIDRVVLIAPALNQRRLLRYWSVRRSHPEVGWENFAQYLDEAAFAADCARERLVKGKLLGPALFQENADRDYTPLLNACRDRVLQVHGAADQIVPLASVSEIFRRRVVVAGGNHEVESNREIEEWLEQVISFLKT